ncbi:hypothetical protein [Streptomyces sp. GbtcB6]|uniref:hypothetical protein n=1 Tax=Streptomyces sp. GbtcB6 TaxID=2824751 RepID=UPI001C2F3263|nr:hypothetical protein [Streptomyces sp. GbtcB6]
MDRAQLADPCALRAYAHPFRRTRIGLLRREGAVTATRAAGLTGQGQGREKPWQAAEAFTSWPGRTANPEVREAATAVADR